MDTNSPQKQGASEEQYLTQGVANNTSMVCSRTIPRGDDPLVTAATAIELARNNTEKLKIETIAGDSDNQIPSPLVMNSETHSLGRDRDPEITTTLSSKKVFKIEAQKTKKKNTGPANSSGGGANTNANPTSSYTMHSGTESPAENHNLETTITVLNTGSSNTDTKKNNKASSNNTTFTLNMNSNLSVNANANANHNINTNANNKRGVPMIAVTFLLIIGALILSFMSGIYEFNRTIFFPVYGGIAVLVLIILTIVNVQRNKLNTGTSTSVSDKKFPPDSYSFVAFYSPKTNADVFCFGLVVFLFQTVLFSLMVLSVVHPGWRTIGEVDNPDSDFENARFAVFIPANVTPIVRATQIIAILSYMVFPDASLMEITTGIEMFPQLCKRNQNEKVWCIAFSCILRCIQGILALVTVFLLVMTSSDVTQIVLNFTAVNFISLLDNTAFNVAKAGKYGPMLEEAAKEVENKPLPGCCIPEDKYLRYKVAVCIISGVMFGMMGSIFFSQESKNKWITRTIQVEFGGQADLQTYTGCYDILDLTDGGRYNYKLSSDVIEVNQTQFSYCKKDRKWFLLSGQFLDGNELKDPCSAGENKVAAFSSKTDSFDISASFGEPWYSASNEPLDLVLVELQENQKDCRSYPGDGVCNEFFNNLEFKYDGGDCCAGTCTHANCGKNGIISAFVFGTMIGLGNGFPTCKDPSMKPITILLESISISDLERNPFLKFDCDGSNIFSIPVDQSMENNTQTFQIPREANCTFKLEESQHDKEFPWEVVYTISSASSDVILYKGNIISTKTATEYFSVYYLLDETTLSSNIGELLQEKTKLIIDNVLNNKKFTGTLPSQIGLLTKLTELNLAYNDFIGTLPSQIGLMTKLTNLGLWYNQFTGTLPSQIGLMTTLNDLQLENNAFTGTLPSQIGLMTKLKVLKASSNSFSGTLPSQLGLLTKLTKLGLGNNAFSGTLPTEIGLLTELSFLDLVDNVFTGTLPSHIALLTELNTLILTSKNSDYNVFTGALPSQIGLMTKLSKLGLENNAFNRTLSSQIGLMTGLFSLDLGNNAFTGTLPSEIGLLTKLTFLNLFNNAFTGTLPTQIGLLTRLNYLNFENVAFTGTLPSQIGLMARLSYLSLDGTQITGPIPEEIAFTIYYDTSETYDDDPSIYG